MNAVTLEQLLASHTVIVKVTGGSGGIRDLGRLEAAIATQTQNVFGEELYSTITMKAAALIRAIIADHPFVDGNKRTAMAVGLRFLRINGVAFKFQSGEIEDFAVRIATEKLDVPAISVWINAHVKN